MESEGGRPGRKLLIWVGPGWPMLSGMGFSEPTQKQQQQLFDSVVGFSTRLRESQVTLYSVSAGEPDVYAQLYRGYLKGVKSPRQTDNADLDSKVLAIQTGGLVLGPNNDLSSQIDSCVRDASAYYTISFDPPQADKRDEYHDLKVQVDKPKLTVRTSSGYYNQPPGQPLP
jgi:VWFA-related protein